MPNHLTSAHIKWALAHLTLEGDTDLFPRPFEIALLKSNETQVVREVQGLDLIQHKWREPRRALVPKDDLSFRSGAQLDPFDALLFAAIIKSVCKKIDVHRGDAQRERIFSYRLRQSSDGRLYDHDRYKLFWEASRKNALSSEHVLVTDISDFYNQVYHHTVEQEFDSAGVDAQSKGAVLNLLKVCSATTSRGLPIGPHATHLVAELSLRPIDDMLVESGVRYIRFVDDFHIFCASKTEAYRVLQRLAQTLDLVKLQLNKSKTKLVSASDWTIRAAEMIEDRPINEDEADILSEMKAGGGNPYVVMAPSRISPRLSALLSETRVGQILDAYLAENEPDFTRVRWFLRRLTQARTPSGIRYVVTNLERLTPAIADAARYLRSSIGQFAGDRIELGGALVTALDGPIVSANPYLTAIVLSLFANIAKLNHIPRLVGMFERLPPISQREIVLAATNASASAWLRTLKWLDYQDPWVRRAIVMSAALWSADERTHWVKSQRGKHYFLDTLIAEAMATPTKTKEFQDLLKNKARRDAKRIK